MISRRMTDNTGKELQAMKIGLITFHNALNYGAALQAFATQTAINNMGHDCVIIDYVNPARSAAYDMKSQIKQSLKKNDPATALKMTAGTVFMNKRRKEFEKFYANHTIRTKRRYCRKEELEELNDEFDLFIAGSDQIWNPAHNGGDTAFLLDFVWNKSKTASYSSSFGLSELPDEYRNAYADSLNAIRYLSAREAGGVQLIEDLTRRRARLVLDPVFLLGKREWESLCAGEKTIEEPFIFEYTNRPGQLEKALDAAGTERNGSRVHKISRHVRPADFIDSKTVVDYSISPERFVANIRDASLVVSASFHCIALSIILEKPFIAVLSGDPGRDSRIENLLEISGLSDRSVSEDKGKINASEPIDFTRSKMNLQAHLNNSLDFLCEATGVKADAAATV